MLYAKQIGKIVESSFIMNKQIGQLINRQMLMNTKTQNLPYKGEVFKVSEVYFAIWYRSAADNKKAYHQNYSQEQT